MLPFFPNSNSPNKISFYKSLPVGWLESYLTTLSDMQRIFIVGNEGIYIYGGMKRSGEIVVAHFMVLLGVRFEGVKPEGSLPRMYALPSWLNPVLTFTTYFSKIHFSVILLSKPKSSIWSHNFGFSNKKSIYFSSPNASYMSHRFHNSCPSQGLYLHRTTQHR
jgi:hypothetical protein